ncbi:MAG: DUF6602 domain-containing protein [Sulfitobacter sp.]|uniref:DUF6602 domain-containing protein n=1 Tax=Sulfitobacter sp. TaxID=1903071 RepID=UPI0030038BE8
MDESQKGLRVRNFFEIEAQTLLERYKIIETLLPHSTTAGAAHRGEEGRFIEALLRSFLNKHLPKNLKAVSGFILCPSTKTGIQDLERVRNHADRHSSQLDVIVYDMDSYPIFEQFEEFCIVPPEGVVGIISVKKTLYNKDIQGEISTLGDAAEICRIENRRGPFTSLFAFKAEEGSDAKLNSRIFEKIDKTHCGGHFDTMVNEVSVLARTCVFKTRPDNGPHGKARYVAIDCTNEGHIVLQRLLQSLMSVYYDGSRGKYRPGFASFRKGTFKDSPEIGLVEFAD